MSVKFFVGLASAGSALVIFGSLFMTAIIFQDINNLYDETMADMAEFKGQYISLFIIY